MAVLAADPPYATVPASGGISTHQLVNSGASRVAFIIKSSNNAQYRSKPVFGFVEPGASTPLEITRLAGPPNEDKMVVQFIEVAADATEGQVPFKIDPADDEMVVIPISAKKIPVKSNASYSPCHRCNFYRPANGIDKLLQYKTRKCKVFHEQRFFSRLVENLAKVCAKFSPKR